MRGTLRQVTDIDSPFFSHFCYPQDGNFHCILAVHEHDSAEYWDKLKRFQERLIERALAVGGTCTGEHGIGTGKKGYLQKQYGEGTVSAMRWIKEALDPLNIMNPGKVL